MKNKIAFGLLALLFFGSTQRTFAQSADDWLMSGFRLEESMDIVRFMADRWRTRGGGNPGFDESLDHVHEYLRTNEFEKAGTLEIIEGPLTLSRLAWDPVSASLSFLEGAPLETLKDNPTMIAKFSASTPNGGTTATIVDVGLGSAGEHYAGIDVKGKIVLARGTLSRVYTEAVKKRGAIGIVSDNLRADELYETHPQMVRVGSLPDAKPKELRAREAWALKIAPRSGDEIRERLRGGPIEMSVKVETRYYEGPQRAVVAEIRGASHPNERIVLVAHVDNNAPGAHNNASGVATHAELARSISAAIQSGELKRPERTITFLFAAEHVGSTMWLRQSRERAKGVILMLNGDMTGFDTENHGGVFRFERTPDPATHSPRSAEERHPEDRVSGWGFRAFRGTPYPGHYLNDLMWSEVLKQSERTGWKVHQNPFEGGSDHDDFLITGVTSALSWYWEDPYISTNLDTPDKIDPKSMRNVAVLHGNVVLRIASASSDEAHRVLELIQEGMKVRLARELATASKRLDAAAPEKRAKIETEERKQLGLWLTWYEQAARSVESLVLGEADDLVKMHIEQLVERWKEQVGVVRGELFAPSKPLTPASK